MTEVTPQKFKFLRAMMAQNKKIKILFDSLTIS